MIEERNKTILLLKILTLIAAVTIIIQIIALLDKISEVASLKSQNTLNFQEQQHFQRINHKKHYKIMRKYCPEYLKSLRRNVNNEGMSQEEVKKEVQDAEDIIQKTAADFDLKLVEVSKDKIQNIVPENQDNRKNNSSLKQKKSFLASPASINGQPKRLTQNMWKDNQRSHIALVGDFHQVFSFLKKLVVNVHNYTYPRISIQKVGQGAKQTRLLLRLTYYKIVEPCV